jgi:hypothetical protein
MKIETIEQFKIFLNEYQGLDKVLIINNKNINKRLDDFLESDIVTIAVMLYGLAWIISGGGIAVVVEAYLSEDISAIVLAWIFCLSGFITSYFIYKHNKS